MLTAALSICLVSAALAAPEEVRFPGGAEGVELAGTLLLPDEGEGPFAAVVLVSGSGPQDRDEAIMGQAPFRVLAEGLAERGIATLRYDDRGTQGLGIGQSTGDFASATTEDFAGDARAAIAFLAGRGEIDAARIGVLGHSEGALVAGMLAAAGEIPCCAVLLGGAGVNGIELMADQYQALLAAQGMEGEAIAGQRAAHRAVLEASAAGAEGEELEEAVRALLREQLAAHFGQTPPPEAVERMLPGAVQQIASPWMRYFLRHDPAADLAASTVPVLALLGERDLQVTDEANAAPLADALGKAGRPGSLVVVVPGKNHLFQDAATGAVPEYATAGAAPAPDVVALIADWLSARAPGSADDTGARP